MVASMNDRRIRTLEELVARYEKSLADFNVINDELRTLPSSDRLTEILQQNENSMLSTQRLLDCARQRLARERALEAVDVFSPAAAPAV